MDLTNHREIFDPSKIEGSVAIVGVGALGSMVALNLSKLGVKELCLYDHDTVDVRNISNQLPYMEEDVGKYKAAVLAERLTQATRIQVEGCTQKVESKIFHEHVIVCVDSMTARHKIFNDCVMFNMITSHYYEGRMNSDSGAAYALSPSDFRQVEQYREELYPDSDVVQERNACGTIKSVGATASMCASYLTWMFINHSMKKDYVNEVMFSINPSPRVISRTFEKSI